MSEEALTDKIEAWLAGQLPAAEAEAFRLETEADPELAKAANLHRLGLAALDQLAADDMFQKFQEWSQEPAPETEPPPVVEPEKTTSKKTVEK